MGHVSKMAGDMTPSQPPCARSTNGTGPASPTAGIGTQHQAAGVQVETPQKNMSTRDMSAREYEVTMKLCSECKAGVEESSGLCKQGCKYDGSLSRPKGGLLIRRYKRVETLLSEVLK